MLLQKFDSLSKEMKIIKTHFFDEKEQKNAKEVYLKIM